MTFKVIRGLNVWYIISTFSYINNIEGESKMPPKENEVELSELYALEEQVEDLKDALYDARKQLKNAIIILEGATNGEVIKAMFPNCEQKEHMNNGYFEMYFDNDLKNASYMRVSKDWWNTPYKKEVEE